MSLPDTMLALRLNNVSSGMRMEAIPIPEISSSEVLIKVSVAGLTPGVVKLSRAGRGKVPTTVGHIAAGTIAAVGQDVSGLAVGDRVRLHPMLSCETCVQCVAGQDQMCEAAAIMGFARFGDESAQYDRFHNGTVAEYVRAPARLVDRVPESIPLQVAAKVHDAATASHALKLARLKKGSVIVLTAPTGAMGTLTLRLAHLYPIKKIILVGRSRERLTAVQSLTSVPTEVFVMDTENSPLNNGDSAPGHPSHPSLDALALKLAALAPEGIDAFIDYLPSNNMLSLILPALRVGGTLVHIGGSPQVLPISLSLMVLKCWTMVGTRANCRADAEECLEWLDKGLLKIDDLITHRFNMNEVEQALESLESRSAPMWLSVINVACE